MTDQENIITTDDQTEKLDQVVPLLRQLEEELQTENPQIDTYLQAINENLRQFPDLVHLLTDEQIKPIYSAMRQKTDVTIAVKASRKSKKTKGLLDDGKSMKDLL